MIILLIIIGITLASLLFYVWFIYNEICNTIENIEERLLYYEKRDGERYREIKAIKNEFKTMNTVKKKGNKK